MKTEEAGKDDLSKCPICGIYLKRGEGFTCPKCRKGPICKSHRASGQRYCSSCELEMNARRLIDLKRQEHGIRSFLRLTQFLFLLCAIFFVSMKMGLMQTVDFLRETPVSNYVIYSMGAVSVIGYLVFYLILLGQRTKIRQMDSVLNEIKYRRLVK